MSSVFTHKWRSEEQGILIGANTYILDNPSLNVRNWTGKNPQKIVLDPDGKLREYALEEKDWWVFTDESILQQMKNNHQRKAIRQDIIPSLLENLYQLNMQSILVEGGAITLQSFINANLWDECHIIQTENELKEGVLAPTIKGNIQNVIHLGTDTILCMNNLSI